MKSDRDRKIEEIKAMMVQAEDEAAKNRLVMFRHSKYRWKVVRLNGTRIAGSQHVFAGELVYGPATHEQCDIFIRAFIGQVYIDSDECKKLVAKAEADTAAQKAGGP